MSHRARLCSWTINPLKKKPNSTADALRCKVPSSTRRADLMQLTSADSNDECESSQKHNNNNNNNLSPKAIISPEPCDANAIKASRKI